MYELNVSWRRTRTTSVVSSWTLPPTWISSCPHRSHRRRGDRWSARASTLRRRRSRSSSGTRRFSREGRVSNRKKGLLYHVLNHVLNYVLSVFWYELRRRKHFDLANSQSISLRNRIPGVCGVRSCPKPVFSSNGGWFGDSFILCTTFCYKLEF